MFLTDQVGVKRHRQALLCAVAATALVFGWQAVLVHVLYAGNWTSLFYHGDSRELPNDEAFRRTFIVSNSDGFDGQYYHIVAHDPLAQRYSRYVDIPVLRYRRILVPGLAFLISLNHHQWIDPAYNLVILLSVFFGTYWAALLAFVLKLPAVSSLAVLLFPGVLCGVERAAVDMTLLFLTLGFLWYSFKHQRLATYLVLVCAGLVRETGLCLTAACVFYEATQRRWTRSAVLCTASLPALLWYFFLSRKLPADPGPHLSLIPMKELWILKFYYDRSQVSGGAVWLHASIYYLAIAAVVVACVLTFRHFRMQLSSPEGIAVLLFALTALFSFSWGLWYSAYNFTRVFAPFVVLLAWQGFVWKKPLLAVPLIAMIPAAVIPTAAKGWQIVRQLL